MVCVQLKPINPLCWICQRLISKRKNSTIIPQEKILWPSHNALLSVKYFVMWVVSDERQSNMVEFFLFALCANDNSQSINKSQIPPVWKWTKKRICSDNTRLLLYKPIGILVCYWWWVWFASPICTVPSVSVKIHYHKCTCLSHSRKVI